jgi:hypothetical protein
MLDFVVGVGWLDTKLKNKTVNLVYDQCDLEAFMKCVSDDVLRIDHDLSP